MLRTPALILALALLFGTCSSAQSVKTMMAERRLVTRCHFSDGKSIVVGYPELKLDRVAGFSGLNESQATTFTSNENLFSIRGLDLRAGEYGFSIIPDSNHWFFVLSGPKGSPTKSGSPTVARVPMSVTLSSSSVETFTMSFDHTGDSCKLKARWQSSEASLEFSEPNSDRPLTP